MAKKIKKLKRSEPINNLGALIEKNIELWWIGSKKYLEAKDKNKLEKMKLFIECENINDQINNATDKVNQCLDSIIK